MFSDRKSTPMRTTTSVIYLFPIVLFLGVMVIGCNNSKSTVDVDDRLEMDGTQKAIRQEFWMTRDPALNMVPTERLISAMSWMKNARTTQTNDLTWTERGPNNIGGRCRAIMIDKRDATGNTI